MGTYNKGILGSFSGKVGPVVGASWRGREVMRSLPRRGNRVASELQILQRLKFATVRAFLTPLSPLLSRYFGSDNTFKTRNNQAMAYHLKEAVTYVDPNYEMIFNKVQISKGELLGVQSPTVTAMATATLQIDWDNNSGQGQALATDQLLVAVYEPTTKTTSYSLNAGVRSAETANFVLPAYLIGLSVQVWISFASENEKLFATSVYMGSVQLV